MVFNLSSNVSDVFPRVLKLSSEVSECEPLAVGGHLPPRALRKLCGRARPDDLLLRVGHRQVFPHRVGTRQVRDSARLGKTVQVDPLKPKLKPPGTKRLKLEYDGLLSNIGFKFNLRRYSSASEHLHKKMNVPMEKVPAALGGRGLHSFTLELKLSSSRTPS